MYAFLIYLQVQVSLTVTIIVMLVMITRQVGRCDEYKYVAIYPLQ